MKKLLLLFASLVVTENVMSEDLAIVKVEPAEGDSVELLKTLTLSTNMNDSVNYVYYMVNDLNAGEGEDSCIMPGEMSKLEDGTFAAKGLKYVDIPCYEGHQYQVDFYCYSAESQRYQEKTEGGNALAVLTSHFYGKTSNYQYSEVQFVSVFPESGSLFEQADGGLITMTFTSAVAQLTAEINNGMFGDNTKLETTATADPAVWTFTLTPDILNAMSGSASINVAAFDAEGLRVKGTIAEGDDSVIELSYSCYLGSPTFTVSPAEGIITTLSSLTASYAGAINLGGSTAKPVVISKEGEMVQEITADMVTFNDECTEATLPLTTEITEPGTYVVTFPTMFFSLGEQTEGRMSKEQIVTYIIEQSDDICTVKTHVNRQLYNLMGLPIKEPHGLYIVK